MSRLEINSIIYKQETIVVLAAKEDDLPVFGEIQHVVAVDVEQYYSVVAILHTVYFRSHFHAYEVETPTRQEYHIIKCADLVDHHPLGLYTRTISEKCLKLVSLKYHVLSH